LAFWGIEVAKPLISVESIYEAALAVVSEDGPEGLTARNLTARLRCSSTTLYQQVGNREEMLRGLIAYAFERIELDFTPGEDWQSSVTTWCLVLRRALQTRPELGQLMTTNDRQVVVHYVNRLIKVLVEHAFPKKLAVEAGRVLSHTTLSMTLTDLAAPGEPDRPEYFDTVIRWLIHGIEVDLAASLTKSDQR
jgi:AcrR family transcriptional regulator